MHQTLRQLLFVLLSLGLLAGCPGRTDDDDSVPDDDDTTSDDDDATSDDDDATGDDDDDATGDDDDSAGDDDDATGDDDDATGDDDDATGDDDDSAGDDDDATGDDDDATGDDDDSAVGDDDDSAVGDDDDSAVGDDDDATAPFIDNDGDGVPQPTDCDDTDPANFPGNTELCDGQDNDCDVATPFGDVSLEFGVGDVVDPLSNFFAGNLLRVDADTTLLAIEQRLNAPAGQALDWLVYESATAIGGYALLATVPSVVDAANAGSLQLHSSGPLNVPLTAGNYYAVGVYAASGTTTFAAFTEPSAITPASWGAVLSSTVAIGSGVAPAGTSVILGADAWVSQRLTTDGELDSDGDGAYACGLDCDDSTTAAPAASEVSCDLVDNDCDVSTPDCEGGVVVTEIFNNAFGSDTNQEWFEIYNASAVTLDLLGWMLRDDDGERNFVSLPLVLAPGDYAVLAVDDDITVNGGVVADLEYGGSLNFANTADEIVLVSPIGEVVDAVVYATPAFPGQEGTTMSLDPTATDSVSNDDGANWCVSFSVPYAGESTGTPGAVNASCVIPASGAVAGDLVISEYLQNPLGTDGNKEWFEVYNATGAAINLQGWAFEDLGADGFVVTQPVTVVSGDYVVLGKSTDLTANGNAPVAFQYAGSMALGNSDDEVLAFSPEGLLIDEVQYDGGPLFPDPNGATSSLSFSSLDAVSNDDGGNWCVSTAPAFGSSGDLGTPGGDNPSCGP